MEAEVSEGYRSSLKDLSQNSKPLINMLTMLADDYEQHATIIIDVIEDHIQKVKSSLKLPVLYLIDSIVKNLQTSTYRTLLPPRLVKIFCEVFEKVDEKTRQAMFKLRQTWANVIPNNKLYAIDVRVNATDPAWPITATAPEQGSIYVNPKFLVQEKKTTLPQVESEEGDEALMRRQLLEKQQELQKLKLELELAETTSRLEQQRKQLEQKRHSFSSFSVHQNQPAIETKPKDPRTTRDPRRRDPRKAAPSTGNDVVSAILTASKAEPTLIPVQTAPPIITPFTKDVPFSTVQPFVLSKVSSSHPQSGSYPSTSGSRLNGPIKTNQSFAHSNVKKEITSPTKRVSNTNVVGKSKSTGNIANTNSKKSPQKSNSSQKSNNSTKMDKSNTPTKKKNDIKIKLEVVKAKTEKSKNETKNSAAKIDPKNTPRENSSRDNVQGNSRNNDRGNSKDSDQVIGRNTNRGNSRDQDRPGSRDGDRIRTVDRRSNDHNRDYDDRSRHSPRSSRNDEDKNRQNKRAGSKRDSSERSGRSRSPVNTSPRNEQDRNQNSSKPSISLKSDKPDKKSADPRKKFDVDERKRMSPKVEQGSEPEGFPDVKKRKLDVENISQKQEDISDLFGSEDIDYRTAPSVLPFKSPGQKGWAKYKEIHPENYQHEAERRRSNEMESETDIDFRKRPSILPPARQPMLVEMPKIPEALTLENQEAILRVAEQQLLAGLMTHQQHQDVLRQLTVLYDAQRSYQGKKTVNCEEEENQKKLELPRKNVFEALMEVPSKEVKPSLSPKLVVNFPEIVQVKEQDSNKTEKPDFKLEGESGTNLPKTVSSSSLDKTKESVPDLKPEIKPEVLMVEEGTTALKAEANRVPSPVLEKSIKSPSPEPATAVESADLSSKQTESCDFPLNIPCDTEFDPRMNEGSWMSPQNIPEDAIKSRKSPNKIDVFTSPPHAFDQDLRNRKMPDLDPPPLPPRSFDRPVSERDVQDRIGHPLDSKTDHQREHIVIRDRLEPSEDSTMDRFTEPERKQRAPLDHDQLGRPMDSLYEDRPNVHNERIRSEHVREEMDIPADPKILNQVDRLRDSHFHELDKPRDPHIHDRMMRSVDPFLHDRIERPMDLHDRMERPRDSHRTDRPGELHNLHGPRDPHMRDRMDMPRDSQRHDRMEMPRDSDMRDNTERQRVPPIHQELDRLREPIHDEIDRPRDMPPPFRDRHEQRDLPFNERMHNAHGPDFPVQRNEFGNRPRPMEFDDVPPHHRDLHQHAAERRIPIKSGPVPLLSLDLEPPVSVKNIDRLIGSPDEERIEGRSAFDDRRIPDHEIDRRGPGLDIGRRGPDFERGHGPDLGRRGPGLDMGRRGPEIERRAFVSNLERRGPDHDRLDRRVMEGGVDERNLNEKYGRVRDRREDLDTERFDRKGKRGRDRKQIDRKQEDKDRILRRDEPSRRSPVIDKSKFPLIDKRWGTLGFYSNRDKSEIIINNRAFELFKGDPPRSVTLSKFAHDYYADPKLKGITVDDRLVYNFGEPPKDCKLPTGEIVNIFYLGIRKEMWIDGIRHEVRIDAPPKKITLNNKSYGIQIDGNDMMILIDRMEKGQFGGSPRQIFVDGVPHDLRFEPQPRQILVDGKACDLDLNKKVPVLIINGEPRMVRFDGPPRVVRIDKNSYQVRVDYPSKVKIGVRSCLIALGGPGHELIINGKWHEIKFDNVPREITINDCIHKIALEGPVPQLKILDVMPSGFEDALLRQTRFALPWSNPLPQQNENEQGDSQQNRPGMPMMGQRMIGSGGPQDMGPRMFQSGPQQLMGPSGQPVGSGMQQMGESNPQHNMRGPGSQQRRDPGSQNRGTGPQQMLGSGPQQMAPQVGINSGMFMNQGGMGPNVSMSNQMGMGMNQMSIQGNMQPMNAGFNQQQFSGGMPGNQSMVQTGGVSNVLSMLMPGQSNVQPNPASFAGLGLGIDIGSLFTKLVAAGIVPTSKPSTTKSTNSSSNTTTSTTETKPKTINSTPLYIPNALPVMEQQEEKAEPFEPIPDISDFKVPKLKKKYRGVVQRLYDGIQCSTCGIRFVMDDTERYREHLDWHFRQNKRGKAEFNMAKNRQWHYEVNDWILFELIEESEEKARSSVFENMMNPNDNSLSFKIPEGCDFIQEPPAKQDIDNVCCICHDPFEQFWHEENEDWHLRDALLVDSKYYHPVCFEDARDESILDPTPTPTESPDANPFFNHRLGGPAAMYSNTPKLPLATPSTANQKAIKTESKLSSVSATVKKTIDSVKTSVSITSVQKPEESTEIKMETSEIQSITNTELIPEIKSESTEVAQSEVQAQQPEIKPHLSEVKPQLSEVKPQLSEIKPQLSEIKPQLSEVTPQLSEVTPQLLEVKIEQPEIEVSKGTVEKSDQETKNTI